MYLLSRIHSYDCYLLLDYLLDYSKWLYPTGLGILTIDEPLPMYLVMCSYSTVMPRKLAQPKVSADRLSFSYLHTTVNKHANILVKSLPEYQELILISVHKCSYTYKNYPMRSDIIACFKSVKYKRSLKFNDRRLLYFS